MAANGLVGYRTACDLRYDLVCEFGEVKYRKFPLKFDRKSVPRLSRLGRIIKEADSNPYSTMLHTGEPFAFGCSNSSIAGGIVLCKKPSVRVLHCLTGKAKIRASVIESVLINVVYATYRGLAKNELVHRCDDILIATPSTANCVPKSISIWHCAPSEPHQFIVESGIHDGVESTSEGYFAAGFTVNPKGVVKYRGLFRPHIASEAELSDPALHFSAAWALLVCPWLSFYSRFSTIASWLCSLFIQVRHSIPRYRVRRGAALIFPSIVQVSHG
jgi:hypothetical protein